MSYYSTVWFEYSNPVVDSERVRDVEKEFASSKYGFKEVELVTRNTPNASFLIRIKTKSAEAKFYDDLEFAWALASVLVSGWVKVHFEGEDGTTWGYKITPGKVDRLVYVSLGESELKALLKTRKASKKRLRKLFGGASASMDPFRALLKGF